MLNKCYCATCIGVEAVVVTVEVDLSLGIGIHLVGLPDSAVRESLLRVITALTSYGFRIPGRKLVVNLAPADIRKEGSAYDLAIALGVLAASEQVSLVDGDKFLIMGELALDGRIRAVNGVLPVALKAREEGFGGCIFPAESAREAADVDGLAVYGVSSLAEAIEVLTRREQCEHLRVRRQTVQTVFKPSGNDFRQVRGQALAKRGMEIAAAAGHNIILVGAPGSGKSLMASCLPSILPPMTREEAIETGKVYSVAGRGARVSDGLMQERPFRAPHHSASLVSLIGGGQNAAPGEISLANNGVLYMDEIAQFSRSLLDALRQPLEDGRVTISRAKYKVDYPAHFMLVASMNPCPCGYYGDDTGRCTCTRGAVEGYLSRISGPMMDRIDLQIWVKSLSAVELLGLAGGGPLPQEESSAAIAARVARARAVQEARFEGTGIHTNAAMSARQIEQYCRLSEECRRTLEKILDRMGLSARAYTRILKVARTIADLAGEPDILPAHLLEAAGFRFLDRRKLFD